MNDTSVLLVELILIFHSEKVEFIEDGCLQNTIEYFLHRRKHLYLAIENIHDVLINEVIYGVNCHHHHPSPNAIHNCNCPIIFTVSCDLCADCVHEISVE